MAHTPKPQRRRKKQIVRTVLAAGGSRQIAERFAQKRNRQIETARALNRLGKATNFFRLALDNFTAALGEAGQSALDAGQKMRMFRPGGILPAHPPTHDQETP